MGLNIKLPKIFGNKPPPVTSSAANAINLAGQGKWDEARHEVQMVHDPGYKYIWSPLNEKKIKPPSASGDPTVDALKNRLYGEAQDFEGGLGIMGDQASRQIDQEGQYALKSGLKGTRQNFNRRGLLYSGLREGGEQDVRGKVASTMAGQKAQSNKELSDMAKAKWTTAAQAGLQGYQDAVNREAEIEGINLQNQVARAQAMQQIGQIGGYGAGAYMNSGSGSQSQPRTVYGSTPNYSQEFRNGNLSADSRDYSRTA